MNQKMNEADQQPLPYRDRMLKVGVISAGLLICVLLAVSCNHQTTEPVNDTLVNQNEEVLQQRCDDRLNSAFASLQPENLELSSNPADAAQQLNTWYTTCSGLLQEQEPTQTEEKEPTFSVNPAKLIHKNFQTELKRENYNVRDVGHIRDSILIKRIVAEQEHAGKSELDRVVHLFAYLQNNFPLEAYNNQRPPLSRYRILLYGTTYPEDRAWLFASMLRQIRIDSVIIRPKTKSNRPPKGNAWIMGVLVDGDVYLFDCRLGLPVMSGDRVATLTDAINKPALLRRWDIDIDNPYPLSSNNLKSVGVEIIGTMCTFSRRMSDLQSSLSGDQSVIINEPLEDNYHGPGLIRRVAEAGKAYWKPEDIQIWNYPEVNEFGYAQMDKNPEKATRWYQLNQLSLRAPATFKSSGNPANPFIYEKPLKEQWSIRIAQLLGQHKSAISRYLSIREWGKTAQFAARLKINTPIFLQYYTINTKAGQDALFWTTLCQFERGDIENAQRGLEKYAKDYTANGFWINPAQLKLAELSYQNGNLETAIQRLARIPEQAPQYQRSVILKRRWEAELKKTQSSESAAENKEDQDKAESKPKPEKSADDPDSKNEKPESSQKPEK